MAGPSSSSSVADRSFRAFLGRSLEAIALEVPSLERALAASLAGTLVRLCVDDERMVVATRRDGLVLVDDRPDVVVELATDSATLLDLTSGETSFLRAALDERMVVRGAPDEVVRFYDSLILYLQAAVRSPSLPGLLEAFDRSRRGLAPADGGP